jgi:hypothetical protein
MVPTERLHGRGRPATSSQILLWEVVQGFAVLLNLYELTAVFS